MQLNTKQIIPAILLTGLSIFTPLQSDAESFDELTRRLGNAISPAEISAMTLEAEKGEIQQSMIPADPEAEFEYLWPSAKDESNRWSAGISQQLPDFRRLHAARRVVRALDDLEILERNIALREASYEAQKRLIDFIAAKRELRLVESIHDTFNSLTEAYTAAWERGEVTILDLNKIKIEHARAHAAADAAVAKVEAAANEIVSLSGGTITPRDLEDLTDYPVFDLDSFSTEDVDVVKRLHESDFVHLLEARYALAQTKYNLASKERFPQLSLGYTHAYEDGIHFNGLNIGLTLPVYSHKGTKASAMAQMLSTGTENDLKIKEIEAEVTGNISRYRLLGKQISMLAGAVENTNNMRLLKKALDSGEISLLEYLLESSYFTEAAREYNAVCQEYALTGAALYYRLAEN